jgi:A/G-specific adenine glycosylase
VSKKLTPTDDPAAFRRKLKTWFRKHQRDLPWRRDRSPYRVVVSEFMLQQTQVATVIPYYEKWMNQFPGWQDLAQADEQTVLKAWEGLGYYSRARNLHRLARQITAEFAGCFPQDPDVMKKLPGIGPYTAGAVASLAFNRATPILDGNVERVFARLFNIRDDIKSGRTQERLWSLAEELLPIRNPGEFNEALMELGALVCIPGTPRCLECPVRTFCSTSDPASLPFRQRALTTRLKIDYAFVEKEGQLWLVAPEVSGRWKGFYRLPEVDVKNMETGRVLGEHTFSITRYRIRGRVVAARWKKEPPLKGKWIDAGKVMELPLPAPIRKMLQMAEK